MATNPNVLKNREHYLGGSEISTIMGINKFRSRYDLLLEKAQFLKDEFDGNIYTEFGDKFEPIIRDYINQTEEDKFVEDTVVEEKELISNRCNYDGKNKTTALEIKTTGTIHETVMEYKYYLVQLLWGMMLGKLKKGKLVVYHREDFEEEFDPSKLQIFDIDIDDYQNVVEEINRAVEQFRIDLQKVRENPLITEEELMPHQVVELTSKLALVEDKLLEYNNLVAEQKKLKEELKNAMQKHGIKRWITNNGSLITLIPDGEDKVVSKFNEKKFSEENEELYKQYLEDKIQKGKSGYIRVTLKGE